MDVNILNEIYYYLNLETKSKDVSTKQTYRLKSIELYVNMLKNVNITKYHLKTYDENEKNMIIDSYFNLGNLYKNYSQDLISLNNNVMTNESKSQFYNAINAYNNILSLKINDEKAKSQMISVFVHLCYYAKNDNESLQYLKEAQFIDPTNEIVNYNLGFIYQKLNDSYNSLIHYKISLQICKMKNDDLNIMLNTYSGLACTYKILKNWIEALYYLKEAEIKFPSDPDIQNHLGVVYTELRRTDLSKIAFEKALKNSKKSIITKSISQLKADIYLNYGHMFSYNGDNIKSIEYYNKSLEHNKSFRLPFQNKLMNLVYISNDILDHDYIYNQYIKINKIIKKTSNYTHKKILSNIINLGFVSADFLDHPVSYFISNILKYYNKTQFKIYCYSESLINTNKFYNLYDKSIKMTFIKGLDTKTACDIIYNDNIHILFDLSVHTSGNRIDIFRNKPAPIQINYIGYPYTSGLFEMDYKITDIITEVDTETKLNKYTEKLLLIDNCFICYNPLIDINTIKLPKIQPYIKNNYITLCCFNRLNKINDSLITLLTSLLDSDLNLKIVFKTKALLNDDTKKLFLSKFSKSENIIIKDCTISHDEHLLEYNNCDIAIDTYPYSGTTTTCESLLMGVPVLTFYDTTKKFHAQNVSASILKNSSLDDYIIYNYDLLSHIKNLLNKDKSYWTNLKNDTRKKFLNGYVCNHSIYLKKFQSKLKDCISDFNSS